MKTIEELLKEAINEQLDRTQVREVKDHGSYNLYELELDNNNIMMSELAAIAEVVGDDDLQVETIGNLLYVAATIDNDTIDEIRSQYDE